MNKYIARVKEFNKKHEIAISTAVTVTAAVLIYRYKQGKKPHIYSNDRMRFCQSSVDHVVLTSASAKEIEAGGVKEFVDLVVMSKNTLRHLNS